MQCLCFMCGQGFESTNEDDIAGDGKCVECTEKSKRAAFKVDIEMSNKRRIATTTRVREMFSEEQIRDGLILDPQGRIIGGTAAQPINIKGLGITPHD